MCVNKFHSFLNLNYVFFHQNIIVGLLFSMYNIELKIWMQFFPWGKPRLRLTWGLNVVKNWFLRFQFFCLFQNVCKKYSLFTPDIYLVYIPLIFFKVNYQFSFMNISRYLYTSLVLYKLWITLQVTYKSLITNHFQKND